ncbi:hypothetical protein CHOTACABRAS_150 [Bacillus phage Chotacabras]|nr:hypothetical protein CHOTACABRAS_150 [Bacillus phage Chotacabras]
MAKVNVRQLKEEVDRLKKLSSSLRGHYCTFPADILEMEWLGTLPVHCKISEVDLSEGYVGVVFIDPDPDSNEKAIGLIEYLSIDTFQDNVRWGWCE